MNRECWAILGVPEPPFIEISFGGTDLPAMLNWVMNLPEVEWQTYSEKCRSWVVNFYDPKRLVKRWDEVYEEILK